MKKSLLSLATLCFIAAPVMAADDQPSAPQVSVTGEVLDLTCYTDHGAQGEKHAGCAQHCIASGLPVGIKSKDDGKVYVVVGAHKPMNKELAEYGGKTVTLKGKAVSRDGVNLLENAELVK